MLNEKMHEEVAKFEAEKRILEQKLSLLRGH